MHLTKRQREILDFIGRFIAGKGYAPSIEEIGRRFGLSSPATVHKHLANLQGKGAIRRLRNRSRSIEIAGSGEFKPCPSFELPLLGLIAAGKPIEAVEAPETISFPEDLVGSGNTYVLRVKGDSMIGEHIRDGDYVIVERRETAENGDTVIALIDGDEATLKKYYRRGRNVLLEPANPGMEPLTLEAGRVQIQGVVVAILRKY